MAQYRRVLEIAAEQHGLLTMADAVAAGISRNTIIKLASRGVLERVAHGIYRIPELAGDPLGQHQAALLMFQGGALSHDTALDLHGLCDINPTRLHLTLPTGRRVPRKAVPAWLVLHRGRLEEGDITWHQGLAIVTPARAIIEGIEGNVGQRFIEEAMDAARRRGLLSAREQQAIETAAVTQRLHQLTRARH